MGIGRVLVSTNPAGARRSAWSQAAHRFGLYGTVILPLCTVLIWASLSVLLSFWIWGNRISTEDPHGVWTSIAFRGYNTQIVTISTAIIRTCIAAQGLVSCYILASLSVEYGQLKDEDMEMMFIYQHANSGPLELLWPILRGFRPRRHAVGIFTLVSLMACSAVISQLFSTILFSDMRTMPLRGSPFQTRPFYNSTNITTVESLFNDGEPADTLPIDFPLFAESADNRTMFEGSSTSPAVGDTGIVTRAFVPITSGDQRKRLASYQGPAAVLDSRFVCFPPTLNNLHLKGTSLMGAIGRPEPRVLEYLKRLNENRDPKTKLLELHDVTDEEWDKCTFECAHPPSGWLRVCTHSINCTALGPQWDLIAWNSDNITDEESTWQYYQDLLLATPDLEWNATATGFQGEFQIYRGSTAEPVGDQPPLIWNGMFSVCTGHRVGAPAQVTVTSPTNFTEPILYGGSAPNRMNTSQLQRQLRVQSLHGRVSNRDRGVWDLKSFDQTQLSYFTTISPYPRGILGFWTGNTWDLTILPASGYFDNAVVSLGRSYPRLPPSQESLLRGVLNDTGSLALALQAYTTVQFAAKFYRAESELLQAGDARVQMFGSALIPRGWLGFAIVTAFTVTHFAVLAFVFGLYAQSKSFGRLWTREDLLTSTTTATTGSGKYKPIGSDTGYADRDEASQSSSRAKLVASPMSIQRYDGRPESEDIPLRRRSGSDEPVDEWSPMDAHQPAR